MSTLKTVTFVIIISILSVGCDRRINSTDGTSKLTEVLDTEEPSHTNNDSVDTNPSFNSSNEPFNQFVKGDKYEVVKWYHDKGHLAAEGPMKKGKRHGLWKVYGVEDGNLYAEVYFKDDEKLGILTSYYESGQLKQKNEWEDYKIISEKCWDENGSEIDCI